MLRRSVHAHRVTAIAAGALLLIGGLYAFQQPFREYPGVEYDNFPKPADWNVPAMPATVSTIGDNALVLVTSPAAKSVVLSGSTATVPK